MGDFHKNFSAMMPPPQTFDGTNSTNSTTPESQLPRKRAASEALEPATQRMPVPVQQYQPQYYQPSPSQHYQPSPSQHYQPSPSQHYQPMQSQYYQPPSPSPLRASSVPYQSIERYTPAPELPLTGTPQREIYRGSTAWTIRGYPTGETASPDPQRRGSTAWTDRGYPIDGSSSPAPLPSSPTPAQTPAETPAPANSRAKSKTPAAKKTLVSAKDQPPTLEEKILAVQLAVGVAQQPGNPYKKDKKTQFWKEVTDQWQAETGKEHKTLKRSIKEHVNAVLKKYKERTNEDEHSGTAEAPVSEEEIACLAWEEVLKKANEHEETLDLLTKDTAATTRERQDLLQRMSGKTPRVEKKAAANAIKNRNKPPKDSVPHNLGYEEDEPNPNRTPTPPPEVEEEETKEVVTKGGRRTRPDGGELTGCIKQMNETSRDRLRLETDMFQHRVAMEERRAAKEEKEMAELEERQLILQRQVREEADSRKKEAKAMREQLDATNAKLDGMQDATNAKLDGLQGALDAILAKLTRN